MSVNKVNSDGSLLRVAGGTLYADSPIGTIVPFGGSVIPSGYLLCNGAEVLKTTYAELYAVIGDAFGTASINTKFVLPDLRETVPVGVGENDTQTIAVHDIYTLGEFKDDSLGKHDHPLIVSTRATYNTAGVPVGIGNNNTPTTATHGKQLGVNYIIKAKQVAVPADFIDAVDELLSKAYVLTCPTSGYTSQSVSVWGVTKTLYKITLTADSGGNPLSNFHPGMKEDYPLNINGTQADFGKLYAYEIGEGEVNLYFTSAPSTAFNVLIREAV